MSLQEHTLRLRELKQQKEEIEQESSKIGKEILRVQGILIEEMHDQNVEAVQVGNITFSINPKIKVKTIDPAALFKWIGDTGNEDVVKQTIHHKTLERIVKQFADEAGEFPPGVEVDYFEVISQTKRNK